MSFAVGNVVQLKSGGPLMTVDGFADGGLIICSWFAGTDRRTDKFDAATLERYLDPGAQEPEDYDPYASGRDRTTGY